MKGARDEHRQWQDFPILMVNYHEALSCACVRLRSTCSQTSVTMMSSFQTEHCLLVQFVSALFLLLLLISFSYLSWLSWKSVPVTEWNWGHNSLESLHCPGLRTCDHVVGQGTCSYNRMRNDLRFVLLKSPAMIKTPGCAFCCWFIVPKSCSSAASACSISM